MNAPDNSKSFTEFARTVTSGNCILRALVAYARAITWRTTPEAVARECWPHDRATQYAVLRAAVNPAKTTVAGWAAELATTTVADALQVLYAASAGAAVLADSFRVTFGDAAAVRVPGVAIGAANTAAFVAEGAPIPVFQPLITPAVLNLYKIAGIITMTEEMADSSNAENYIGELLRQAAGRALDEVLVDANPADPARPAGLRQGVAALTPSAAGDPWTAFVQDVRKLADAVGPVASNAPIAFIGSPGRAAMAKLFVGGDFPDVRFYGSGAVINDFLCIATAGLATAAGDLTIESNRVATVHQDNTNPAADLMTAGPTRSLFQTASVGLKVRWPLSWVKRDPRAFAWMTPTGW